MADLLPADLAVELLLIAALHDEAEHLTGDQ